MSITFCSSSGTFPTPEEKQEADARSVHVGNVCLHILLYCCAQICTIIQLFEVCQTAGRFRRILSGRVASWYYCGGNIKAWEGQDLKVEIWVRGGKCEVQSHPLCETLLCKLLYCLLYKKIINPCRLITLQRQRSLGNTLRAVAP